MHPIWAVKGGATLRGSSVVRFHQLTIPCYTLSRMGEDAPSARNEEEPMSFVESILTEDLDPLRQRLLFHPLWTEIEQGTLPPETLHVFALQDWWLVRQAYLLAAAARAGITRRD